MTSSVLIEALSQGQPVLCGDHCGFTDVVTRDCGVRIPVQTRTQFENDLAAAILHLATDEDRRRKLAAGALERVRYFSWEGKERKIKAIYDRICGEVPVAR
jgi:glycosyltransferase involved in cell wall biosynthesis